MLLPGIDTAVVHLVQGFEPSLFLFFWDASTDNYRSDITSTIPGDYGTPVTVITAPEVVDYGAQYFRCVFSLRKRRLPGVNPHGRFF